MRLLVTGSREWDDQRTMTRALERWWWDNDTPEDAVLVHGAARGADSMAQYIWRALGFADEPHPANWGTYGRAAGFIRNQEMVDSGVDYCIAFFVTGAANRGTSDCVRRARAAGIPVKEVWL